ncbi:MAG: hypothetical protein LIO55_08960 [Oscillospiraceae bacterium]|nr:hypothetical protein [Oscillospiraceae bacterium]
MSEWTVVSVIVGLAGLLLSLLKPLISLNSTLTRLTDTVEKLEQELAESAEKNREAHTRLWDKAAAQDEMLQAHTLQLARLEREGS